MAAKVSFLTKSKLPSLSRDYVEVLWRSNDGLKQCIKENNLLYLVHKIPMEDVATKLFTIPMDAVQLLTTKESDVYEMLVKGMQSKEVALKLNISVRTVKFHIVNIYKKLNVHDRGQLIWSYKNKAAVLNDETLNSLSAFNP